MVLRLPWWLSGKESACQCKDMDSTPGSGRSGEGNGNPLQYSWLGPGKSPWTGEPGGLIPWSHKRVRHDLTTKQQQLLILETDQIY